MSSSENATTYTYEDALKFAKSEAERILQIDRRAVRYVKYDASLKDYCEVTFEFGSSGRSPKTMQGILLNECESDVQFASTHTYEDAMKFAKFEAKRILQADHRAVRYVTYENIFEDYCQVIFEFDSSGRSSMTIKILALNEREGDESLTEQHISSVARGRPLLTAIRLYRLLHGVDLATAKQAVQIMIQQ